MIAPLDVVLVLLIGGLALMGWRSGLIHESATLIGFALGLVAAGRLYGQFGPLFLPWLDNRTMADLAAFVVILIGTWIAVFIAGVFMRDMLRSLHLGWIDGLGGTVLGVVKGLIMAEVIVLVLMVAPGEGMHEAVTHSLLASRLADLGPDLVHLVPAVLRYWKPF